MNFLVFPYNAVLNAGVFDDAVVADSHVRTDGAVLNGDVLPDDARGNQPGIVNGIPLVDGGATDFVEFRAFPGQGRGRALAAQNCGLTPQFFRLEGRVHLTSGPPGPSGFDP